MFITGLRSGRESKRESREYKMLDKDITIVVLMPKRKKVEEKVN